MDDTIRQIVTVLLWWAHDEIMIMDDPDSVLVYDYQSDAIRMEKMIAMLIAEL